MSNRRSDWTGGKEKLVNPVPLSTASTAAPSPRLASTQSPPPGFSEISGPTAPLLASPGVMGTFVNDCPPSPGLTKRLMGHAHSRKRAGRHNLVSVNGPTSKGRILKLSVPQQFDSADGQQTPIDRWAIPDDVYESLLLSASSIKKSSGNHLLERRRRGLSGNVEPVLVIQSGRRQSLRLHQTHPSCTVPLFSPDPSMF